MFKKTSSTVLIRQAGLTGLLILVVILAGCQSAAGIPVAPVATVENPKPVVVQENPPAATSTPEAVVPSPTVSQAVAEVVVPTATEIPAAAEPATPAVPVPAGPTIQVQNDPLLGSILVGDKGMTLYMFTKDKPGKSNCNATCMEKWPPLLASGAPVAGEGIDPVLLGTAALPDGSMIVTYNQMPLYYWINDTQPGDTTGQGVGQVWFVVSPAGVAVTAPVAAEAVSGAEPTPAASANSNSNANDSYNEKPEGSGSDY